jgi:hypothetical protein
VARKIISRAEARKQGLKKYFTGVPCKHGHIAARTLQTCNSTKCISLYQRKCAQERFAKKRIAKLVAREAHDKEMREKLGDLYMPRREAIRLGLRYFYDGRLCLRGHASRRATSNRECIACKHVQTAAWKKKHRGKNAHLRNNGQGPMPGSGASWGTLEHALATQRAIQHNRRALLRQSGYKVTGADILEFLKAQENTCRACPADLRVVGYHVDHKQALSRGGSNEKGNLQLLCPSCNSTKRAMTMEEFMEYRKRLSEAA